MAMNEAGLNNEALREQKESQEFPGINKFGEHFNAIKKLSNGTSFRPNDTIQERYVFSYKAKDGYIDIGAIIDSSGNKRLGIEKRIPDKNNNIVKSTKYYLTLTRDSNFILHTEEIDEISKATSKKTMSMSEQQALSISLPNFNKRINEANDYNTKQLIEANNLAEADIDPESLIEQAMKDQNLRTSIG